MPGVEVFDGRKIRGSQPSDCALVSTPTCSGVTDTALSSTSAPLAASSVTWESRVVSVGS